MGCSKFEGGFLLSRRVWSCLPSKEFAPPTGRCDLHLRQHFVCRYTPLYCLVLRDVEHEAKPAVYLAQTIRPAFPVKSDICVCESVTTIL
jgi:hypothetical protein